MAPFLPSQLSTENCIFHPFFRRPHERKCGGGVGPGGPGDLPAPGLHAQLPHGPEDYGTPE